MPAFTRKRVDDRPVTWHVHYAGVRVGLMGALIMRAQAAPARVPKTASLSPELGPFLFGAAASFHNQISSGFPCDQFGAISQRGRQVRPVPLFRAARLPLTFFDEAFRVRSNVDTASTFEPFSSYAFRTRAIGDRRREVKIPANLSLGR